ncbi:alpha/beta fold hydrolase [Streptomyces jumonjinensis]|uniref:Alpha/beta hydrolase n=1 Tax=Streptomyces jumonjinensis TaxID=1945 RepID=A0A646KHI3_STRJU|nr:alpha/beta hydrolase [Streptomyces jumonjinensis]MQT01457.1 alpha/beta hydrolase [Streptomyces jumonjinensis]
MPFATAADGTALYYEDWGRGRPLVFLGTAMQNSRMWEHVARPLVEAGLRCITVDRRGHGRSDWPWDGYDFDTLADDLAAILDRTDVADAVLVGYAMGGGETVRHLSRHGTERVGAVALVNSVTPFMCRTDDNPEGLDPSVFDGIVAELMADRARWVVDAAAGFFGGPEGTVENLPVSFEHARWLGYMALDCSSRAALESYRTLFTTDLRPDVATLRSSGLPVLLIHGDGDLGAPLELCGMRTARLLPDAPFVVYEGAAHGLFATHADRLVADLLKFAAS